MQAVAHNFWTPRYDALMPAGRPTKNTRPSFGERLALARQHAGLTQQQLAVAKQAKPKDTRLQRRLQQIEKLGAREKRQILQILDTFLENQKLKQRVNGAERTS